MLHCETAGGVCLVVGVCWWYMLHCETAGATLGLPVRDKKLYSVLVDA